jgi:ribosomal protein S18 acetylase RimI-like enzyme
MPRAFSVSRAAEARLICGGPLRYKGPGASVFGVHNVASLGYRTDLMLRALEGSEIVDRGRYLAVRSPANPQFWWGNFLLLHAPFAGEPSQWLAQFAAEFPAAVHVALGMDTADGSSVNPAALLAAGFRRQLVSVMSAAVLREPPHRNRAARYRQLTGDDDWKQSAELRVACEPDDGPATDRAFIEGRVAARRRLAEAGYGAWWGAFLDGQLVAQLGLASDGTGIARYQDVETHPSARRQGLAGTLVVHAGRYGFDRLAATTLVIAADPAEAAIRVYRSIGFAAGETQVGFERPPDGA